MKKLYLLILNDGLGREAEIGLFTTKELLLQYQIDNPKGLYEEWEIKELNVIA